VIGSDFAKKRETFESSEFAILPGEAVSRGVALEDHNRHLEDLVQELEFLRDQLNAPIVYDRVRNVYRYSDHTFSLPSMVLTEGELFALCIAETALRFREAVRRLAGAGDGGCPGALSNALSFESGPIRTVNATQCRQSRAHCNLSAPSRFP
jgi:hypothetical protein